MEWVHNLKPGSHSQAPQIIPVCAVLALVAFFFTALRCYVRTKMIKSFGADDAVVLASTVIPPLCILTQERSKLTISEDLQHYLQFPSNRAFVPNPLHRTPPPPLKFLADKNVETETLADRLHANASEYGRVNFAGRPFYMLGILEFKVSVPCIPTFSPGPAHLPAHHKGCASHLHAHASRRDIGPHLSMQAGKIKKHLPLFICCF